MNEKNIKKDLFALKLFFPLKSLNEKIAKKLRFVVLNLNIFYIFINYLCYIPCINNNNKFLLLLVKKEINKSCPSVRECNTRHTDYK